MLRFLADDYDDTCSTVFPLLQVILAGVSDLHFISSLLALKLSLVQTLPKNIYRTSR